MSGEPIAHGAELDPRRKTFENYRAELARLGFGLFELADGTYLASRWDRCRPCADLNSVGQFLKGLRLPHRL